MTVLATFRQWPRRVQAALLVVLLQGFFLVGWSLTEQQRLGEGRLIRVRPEPVDPRDLLRGQYMTLSYDFSRYQPDQPVWEPNRHYLPAGLEAWALLRPEGEYHVFATRQQEAPRELPSGWVALRGVTQSYGRVEYGIERYFVPEGSPTPAAADSVVELRVGQDGGARIVRLLVNGKPFP